MPVLKGRTKSVVRVARVLLFPAVVAGVFLGALPHIADLEDVWHLILRMTAGQVAILAGGAGLGLLILRDGGVARWAGTGIERLVRRSTEPAWGEAAGRFRDRLVDLLKRRWAFLTLATVVSQLSVYLVLLASLRFVGIADS